MYNTIKSKYLKNLLKKSSWKDHKKIDQLISLEKFIQKSPNSFSGALYFHYLKNTFKKEYLLLCKELNPELLDIEKQIERDQEFEKTKLNRKIDAEQEKKYKLWLKNGGKP